MDVFKNYSRSERVDMLSANAQKRESFSYFKQISEDELASEKENYFHKMSVIDAAKEKLEKAKAEFKEETAAPSVAAAQSYQIIKNKGTQVTEDVYLIPNYDSSMMDYVTEDGDVVFSRRMIPSERQIMMKVSNE